MKKNIEVMFMYNPANNRTTADCLDIYNWLIGIDEKIAQEFKKKYQGAEREIKKKNNL